MSNPAAETTSPYVLEAARRASAIPSRKLQPICRLYLILVDHRDGSYFAEPGHITRGRHMTKSEGLTELQQHDDAVAIFECNPDEGTMCDVSEDMARLWLDEVGRDLDPRDASTWPRFVSRHLTNDEVQELVA